LHLLCLAGFDKYFRQAQTATGTYDNSKSEDFHFISIN
jgi:hypothetical protein